MTIRELAQTYHQLRWQLSGCLSIVTRVAHACGQPELAKELEELPKLLKEKYEREKETLKK